MAIGYAVSSQGRRLPADGDNAGVRRLRMLEETRALR